MAAEEDEVAGRLPDAIAESEELLSGSLDDYLLALADGIYRAQRQLNQLSLELQPGQPSVTYQLPKVEFELRMSYEMSGGAIRVRPADGLAAGGQGSSNLEASSLIRGSFVAVPALGGKPAPVVRTSIERFTTDGGTDPHRYRIVVQVSDTSGARLAGREVRFDIDWSLRDALNLRAGYRGPLDREAAKVARRKKTSEKEEELALDLLERSKIVLELGLAITDQAGRASCEVRSVVPEGGRGLRWPTFVPVRVGALGQSETITFEMPPRGEGDDG